MKISLLIAALFVVSCASNSSKKMESKPVEAKKSEVKETAENEVKKVEEAPKKVVAPSEGAKACNLGSDERVIDNKQVGSGCEVVYTKFGESNVVADAKNDLDFCQEIQDRIVSKLETAGFTCK